MDSDGHNSAREKVGAAGAFRRPSNDAANRKYRRRSPVGESSSDGSPARERSLSPVPPTEACEKNDDSQRRKDDERDLGRDSGRTQHGRSGESHRHSDRQSSRSTHSHRRHDEYTRHSRNEDNDERENLKSYSHHHRNSRGRDYSDHSRQENDHRSRDYPRDVDKYSRDKYGSSGHRSRDKEKESSSLECQKYKEKDSSSDRIGSDNRYTNYGIEDGRSGERDKHKEYRDSRDEKTDHKRNLGEYKSDHSHAYKESRGHRNESTLKKDGSGHRLKEAALPDYMELGGGKYTKEDKKKYDDGERFKERQSREKEKYEDRNLSSSRCQESSAKRSKFYSIDDGSTEHVKDDEKQSSSKQGQVPPGEVTLEQGVKDSDIDAAKVAAMKAAELVNRNLIGTGYMTTDQKKKLLWGSKKSTNDTEKSSAHNWDTSTFGDRERQEKFNKLMGVKGDAKGELKPDIHDAEKQKELQIDLEKQYTAGLRRRDGRTVGLGL
ncbi:arginine/serine-rich coiled-coil protein 2-like isoform X4 [Ipomoea triloba]|uniref:arginine/serine-rich coiled-coil protein 2-like isoform X3 n=1 Tax=Ipomoea triloba TaxID=35885 RepID=UPI00125D1C14|nr:arginine/serine-rich coiled-coil protein 2-like isoform X3 [Ipomoea triloba]XP_031104283.1 arginine/serine-rich coiled-coil protein 2-like isoform X4 [Ipomoea triloba]